MLAYHLKHEFHFIFVCMICVKQLLTPAYFQAFDSDIRSTSGTCTKIYHCNVTNRDPSCLTPILFFLFHLHFKCCPLSMFSSPNLPFPLLMRECFPTYPSTFTSTLIASLFPLRPDKAGLVARL